MPRKKILIEKYNNISLMEEKVYSILENCIIVDKNGSVKWFEDEDMKFYTKNSEEFNFLEVDSKGEKHCVLCVFKESKDADGLYNYHAQFNISLINGDNWKTSKYLSFFSKISQTFSSNTEFKDVLTLIISRIVKRDIKHVFLV